MEGNYRPVRTGKGEIGTAYLTGGEEYRGKVAVCGPYREKMGGVTMEVHQKGTLQLGTILISRGVGGLTEGSLLGGGRK